MHEVLVNRLEGLSLPRKSVDRLTDRPDMTLDVYRGHKRTTQQQQQHNFEFINIEPTFHQRWDKPQGPEKNNKCHTKNNNQTKKKKKTREPTLTDLNLLAHDLSLARITPVIQNTVNPLYNDTRYNSKVRYNDNFFRTISGSCSFLL